jgi:hypothetical protein
MRSACLASFEAGQADACQRAQSARSWPSQARTAAATASRSVRRLWSPATRATVRPRAARGMPNGSRSPCTTSSGTDTASSSGSRLAGGAPDLRRGGRSGNARQRTATAPVSSTAERAPAHDEGQPAQLALGDVLDHGHPGRVELPGRGGGAPAGDTVGLLHEGDAHPLRERNIRRRHEVAGRHAAARSVPEDERPPWLLDSVEVDPCGTVRGVEVEQLRSSRRHISSTDRMLPAGSVNHAIAGAFSMREMPFSSCSKPS